MTTPAHPTFQLSSWKVSLSPRAVLMVSPLHQGRGPLGC